MWTLAQINRFEEIIDVRSPAEYNNDHIPGARNFPVLNDAQRAEIGTIYKQISPFEAKKCGAALVADNISHHLQTHFGERGNDWCPLVYCWRGGVRSAALTQVLRKIGWHAKQLPGGYKAYRRMVVETIDRIAPKLHFKVLCGYTGTGKSLLLANLAQHNAQIVNLEALANHRGSVLGAPTEDEQPSQRHFESLLCRILHELDLNQPVYIEAESRRIGKIQMPTSLLETMRSSQCIRLEADPAARTCFLIREYHHFVEDGALLRNALQTLTRHVSKDKVDKWINWRKYGGPENLVHELLREYYDPLYLRSMKKHFSRYADAERVYFDAIDEETLKNTARELAERTTVSSA